MENGCSCKFFEFEVVYVSYHFLTKSDSDSPAPAFGSAASPVWPPLSSFQADPTTSLGAGSCAPAAASNSAVSQPTSTSSLSTSSASVGSNAYSNHSTSVLPKPFPPNPITTTSNNDNNTGNSIREAPVKQPPVPGTRDGEGFWVPLLPARLAGGLHRINLHATPAPNTFTKHTAENNSPRSVSTTITHTSSPPSSTTITSTTTASSVTPPPLPKSALRLAPAGTAGAQATSAISAIDSTAPKSGSVAGGAPHSRASSFGSLASPASSASPPSSYVSPTSPSAAPQPLSPSFPSAPDGSAPTALNPLKTKRQRFGEIGLSSTPPTPISGPPLAFPYSLTLTPTPAPESLAHPPSSPTGGLSMSGYSANFISPGPGGAHVPHAPAPLSGSLGAMLPPPPPPLALHPSYLPRPGGPAEIHNPWAGVGVGVGEGVGGGPGMAAINTVPQTTGQGLGLQGLAGGAAPAKAEAYDPFAADSDDD